MRVVASSTACLEYLFKYLMKKEQSSSEFKKLTKSCIANANQDKPIKKTLQSTLMKLQTRDISSQEAAFLNCKDRKLVVCSLKERHVNLTGKKSIRLEPKTLGDAVTSNCTFHEVYWDRETNKKFLDACKAYETNEAFIKGLFHPKYKEPRHPRDVSLHLYLAFYNKDWTPSKEQFCPTYTPSYREPVNKSKEARHEEWCKMQLLIFQPGANEQSVTEAFNAADDVTYSSLLAEFVETSEFCPGVLKDDYEISMRDIKQSEAAKKKVQEQVAEDLGSQDDQRLFIDADEVEGAPHVFGEVLAMHNTEILQAMAERNEVFLEQDADDEVSDYEDEGFVKEAQQFEYPIVSANEAKGAASWLDQAKSEWEGFGSEITTAADPDTLNTEQRSAYDVIVTYVDHVAKEHLSKCPEQETKQLLLNVS